MTIDAPTPRSPNDPDPLRDHRRLLRDNGCNLSASCLDCHLERCRYDVPTLNPVSKDRERHVSIAREIWAEGISVDAAAVRYGVSSRTIYRYLASAKRAA